MEANKNTEWARCPKCGHKLFKVLEKCPNLEAIEIKCSSCGEIVTFDASGSPKKGYFRASDKKVDKVID